MMTSLKELDAYLMRENTFSIMPCHINGTLMSFLWCN